MKVKIVLGIVLVCILPVFITFADQPAKDANFDVLFETYGLLKSQYVESITEDRKLVYGAIRGLLDSLGDPYTRFLEPTANSEMKIRLDGEFFGVGIQIGIKNKKLTVIAPIEDTPAFRAGMKSKDQIIRIDGNSTKGISLSEAVSKIRGPKGAKVVLSVYRPTVEPPKELDIPIIRAAIHLKSIRGDEMISKNIGYIRLTTFESKQMVKELQVAMRKLEKEQLKGLILDLRNNGGGLLYNAILSSSIFLENGKDIVHTIGRAGILDTRQAVNIQPKFTKPLIVLVNGNSASASEIFAGAISDNGRGIVVGEKTFGKASVQNVRELSDKSAVLITIAKYQTPLKKDITKVGIKPDFEVKEPTANIELRKDPDYIYDKKDDYFLQEAIKMMREIIE
ncbi:S41 family peptidase [Candidatus Margulisiibacteriota bacterium]